MVTEQRERAVVVTDRSEIDQKLGGGIPVGSLTLVEGVSDGGKSVLVQHFAYGALMNRLQVAYYTTENTVRSLLTQMESLGLEVTDYFLLDRFRIYPLRVSQETPAEEAFRALLDHFASLPPRFEVLIVDSITHLVTHSGETQVLDFFSACKDLCDKGRTLFLVVHSYAFDEKMLIRVRSVCDAHLRLKMEQVGERLAKMLEVLKVRNADRMTGNVISFEVEPQIGMRIIPISRAKA